jgi:hypothetical protein
VYRVGKVDRRGAARKSLHLTLRRQNEYLILIEVQLEVSEELLRIIVFILEKP